LTLEECLDYFVEAEILREKDNLYLKYGKSKRNELYDFRIEEKV
jgi:hypothetical protein